MHLKRLVLAFLFISISILNAQVNTGFAYRYFAPFYQYEFNNVLATDSCYWISGWGTDTVSPYNWTAVIAKIDLSGNLLLKKELRANVINFGWPSGIYHSNNKIYTSYLEPYDSTHIVIYDIILDSIYVYKSFGPLEDSQYLFRPKIFQNNNGETYICWSSNINAGSKYRMEVYLIKLDSLGNELLNKRITFNNRWFVIGDIEENKNSDILLYGYLSLEHYIKNNDESLRDYILVLNKYGDSLTSITNRNSMNAGINDLIQLDDNSYICATSILSHKGSITGLPAILKLDSKGRMLWRIIPDSSILSDYWSSNESNMLKIIQLNSNKFTALGNLELVDPEDSTKGTGNARAIMINFDSSGNMNWQRIYVMPDAINIFSAFDFKQTKDGGYIICGSGPELRTNTIVDAAFLIKTDSLGCIVPGCSNSVNVEDIKNGKQKAIEIYPNPVSDKLYMLSRINSKSPLRMSLINLQGEVVLQNKINVNEGVQYIIAIPESIPSSTYILQILDNKGKVWMNEKILKK